MHPRLLPTLGTLLLAASGFGLGACGRGDAANSSAGGGRTATTASASSAVAPSSPMVLAPHDGIHWLQAPSGITDAAPAIHDAEVREHALGRTLLVYVGATWCEPCQRFHHAVDRGELDTAFPHLSIIAFDADRDAQLIEAAGYHSHYIPMFALPGADGRSTGKHIEGSVKGEAAVGEITPRLQALINGSS